MKIAWSNLLLAISGQAEWNPLVIALTISYLTGKIDL
jgi:hypothetical protein